MTTTDTNEIFNNFKGYSLFTEVEDKIVQAFNRWNILSNLHENNLDHLGLEYIEQLPEYDRMRLALMSEYIKRKGLEETKREVIMRAA